MRVNAISRIDSLRPDYKPSGGDVVIFDEKVRVNAISRIDSLRPDYKPSGGDVVIFDEKVKIEAKPRIDSKFNQSSLKNFKATTKVPILSFFQAL